MASFGQKDATPGFFRKAYPLVNIQKAIENGHQNSGFSHKKWWIFPLQTVSSPEGTANLVCFVTTVAVWRTMTCSRLVASDHDFATKKRWFYGCYTSFNQESFDVLAWLAINLLKTWRHLGCLPNADLVQYPGNWRETEPQYS